MVKRLLMLNGLAVIGAVINHGVHWPLIAMFWWTDRYREIAVPNFDQLHGLSYVIIRLIDQVAFVGLPSFLMISGFFIAFAAGRAQETIKWSLVFTRIKYLFIPYFLWNVVILLMDILQGESITILEFAKTLLTGSATAAYYYVPLLITFYLISPFLVPVARKRPLLILTIAALLPIPVMIGSYDVYLDLDLGWAEQIFKVLRDSHFLDLAFLFVLGMTAGLHLPEFKRLLQRLRRLLIPALAITFIVGIVEWDILLRSYGKEWLAPQTTLFDKVFALILLLTFFAYENFVPPKPDLIVDLGIKSYGIFLIHIPVQEITARGIYHLAPQLLAYSLLILFIVTVVGIAVPVLMMKIVDKSPLRRYYKFIFG